MKRELADECDYIREADAGRRFKGCLEGDEYFDVPRVIDEASSGKVLTTAWMEGRALSRMKGMKQDTRDKVSSLVVRCGDRVDQSISIRPVLKTITGDELTIRV